jgi:hypothetical protein
MTLSNRPRDKDEEEDDQEDEGRERGMNVDSMYWRRTASGDWSRKMNS